MGDIGRSRQSEELRKRARVAEQAGRCRTPRLADNGVGKGYMLGYLANVPLGDYHDHLSARSRGVDDGVEDLRLHVARWTSEANAYDGVDSTLRVRHSRTGCAMTTSRLGPVREEVRSAARDVFDKVWDELNGWRACSTTRRATSTGSVRVPLRRADLGRADLRRRRAGDRQVQHRDGRRLRRMRRRVVGDHEGRREAGRRAGLKRLSSTTPRAGRSWSTGASMQSR